MQSLELAQHLSDHAQQHGRILVAIAGPPGSGKSTLAEKLHAQLVGRGENAIVVPMDGFHLDNRILEARNLWRARGHLKLLMGLDLST